MGRSRTQGGSRDTLFQCPRSGHDQGVAVDQVMPSLLG
jgi:hypothetical protein